MRHPQADHPELEGSAYYTAFCWQRPDRQAYESFWAWVQDLEGSKTEASPEPLQVKQHAGSEQLSSVLEALAHVRRVTLSGFSQHSADEFEC